MMRILVAGAGAIGMLFSGLIWLNGGEVVVYTRRREAAHAIESDGVLIEYDEGVKRARPSCAVNPSKLQQPELCFICVKSYDTQAVAQILAPHLPENCKVVTVQNGLNNVGRLSEIFGSGRVVGGYTTHAVTLLGLNRVYHAYQGEIVIGGHPLTTTEFSEIKRIATELSRYGLTAQSIENVFPGMLQKLVVNAVINPLTALLGVRNGEIIEIKSLHPLIERLLEECVVAIKELGINIEPGELRRSVDHVATATAKNRSSMLQDIERRRDTEIDYINGVIAAILKERGYVWSVNEALTNLIHALELRGRNIGR